MSLRVAWAADGISGQAGVQSNILSQIYKYNNQREDPTRG